MTEENYSISVQDAYVEIKGHLTIEEAFDFLSFYERKGYTRVASGFGCTLFLAKPEEHIEYIKLQDEWEAEYLIEKAAKEDACQLLEKANKDNLKLIELIKKHMPDLDINSYENDR